jgi:hypothetical protein
VVYVHSFLPYFFFRRSRTDVIIRGLRTVYIEDAFGEDEFVADLIPTQVTETPHASKSLTLTLTLSHLDPFKDVEGMA